jgi:hypothetical protein
MRSFNKLREFLDNSLVAYEVLTHPVTFTAQQLAAVQHVKGKQLAKVVVARSGSEFIMIVLPAPYHVGLERARAATGWQDLEIAHESEFASLFAVVPHLRSVRDAEATRLGETLQPGRDVHAVARSLCIWSRAPLGINWQRQFQR